METFLSAKSLRRASGGGGADTSLDVYGFDRTGLPQAKVHTKRNPPIPDLEPNTFKRLPAAALEDAIWSAKRDTGTGYGVAVLDLDPGEQGGKTRITMNYYHASGADKTPTTNYELFETIVFAKQRRA
jgi:hypothetical protein